MYQPWQTHIAFRIDEVRRRARDAERLPVPQPHRAWMRRLRRLPPLAGARRRELGALLAASDRLLFAPGQVVIARGRPARDLLVVAEGELAITRDGHDEAVLREGSVVGDPLFATPSAGTIVARSWTELLVLGPRQLRMLRARAPRVAERIAGPDRPRRIRLDAPETAPVAPKGSLASL